MMTSTETFLVTTHPWFPKWHDDTQELLSTAVLMIDESRTLDSSGRPKKRLMRLASVELHTTEQRDINHR